MSLKSHLHLGWGKVRTGHLIATLDHLIELGVHQDVWIWAFTCKTISRGPITEWLMAGQNKWWEPRFTWVEFIQLQLLVKVFTPPMNISTFCTVCQSGTEMLQIGFLPFDLRLFKHKCKHLLVAFVFTPLGQYLIGSLLDASITGICPFNTYKRHCTPLCWLYQVISRIVD